jgi:predicted lipid-binding transport protein (Tim44 family)
MKKLSVALLLAISAMSMLVASTAEAKRLGGGSFGRQSQNVSRQAPAQSSQAPIAAPAPPPIATPAPMPPPASPWKGIVGGALLGLGVGALMSHFGLGGALGSMLGTIVLVALLAMLVMLVMRMFRRKAAVPAEFDVPAFLRNAKTYFIRLQAAWDKADIHDIQEFTTTEMFAELKLQIQERGDGDNLTDVVTIGAELLGVETAGDNYLASVKFTGMIKESENAAVEPFSEVWNLSKPVHGSGGWVLAGIQQLS